jgi:hypothetical protein
MLVLDLIVKLMDTLATIKIGPKERRIGIFGSYHNAHKQVIIELMKNISKLGWAAITGEGYYLPNDPETFHDINEIKPKEVSIFFDKCLPEYEYLENFPRIVKKAIIYMNYPGAWVNELIGCYNFNVPFIGFIIHPEISVGRNVHPPDCEYLIVKDRYVECFAPGKEYCPFHKPANPFCPFYLSVDISWTYKQLFLERKVKSRLIAVHDLKDFEAPLQEFLKDPYKLIIIKK